MKITKYEKYVNELGGCLKSVKKALDSGAMLTDMELFDYYFKGFIYGFNPKICKNLTDRVYRCAYFCSEVIDGLFMFKHEGYSYEDANYFISNVCAIARMYRLSSHSYTVYPYDSNNILYWDFCLRGRVEHTFVIKSLGDLVRSSLIIASFLASESIKSKELKKFVSVYMSSVYSDVENLVSPEPYVNKGIARSLKNCMKEEKKPEPVVKEKVVNFMVG